MDSFINGNHYDDAMIDMINTDDDDFLSYDEIINYKSQQQQQEPLHSNSSVGSEVSDDEWFLNMDQPISPVQAGLEDFKQFSSSPPADDQACLPSFDDICQQLKGNNNAAQSPCSLSVFSSDSNHSQESVCSYKTLNNRSSKFETSKFVQEKKRGKKAKQEEEKTVRKRAKKEVSSEIWQHNKFSASASYVEINTTTPQVNITFEVFQTKRRQNAPLESDKNDIHKICEISFQMSNLDTTKTNYVSLKGRFDKEAIYGTEKVTKFYTWIRLKGTEEYLFLYCQTGKTTEVHNIVNYDNGRLGTRSDHLSKYSGKCSNTAQVIRSKPY